MSASLRSITIAGLAAVLAAGIAAAQEPYRTPPPDVVSIVDAAPTPVIRVSPDGAWMALTERRAYPSIAQLAEPALGLAGIRFNPRINGDDQPPLGIAIKLVRLEDGREWDIELPQDVQLTYPFWSPNGTHLAFSNTTDDGVELWAVSVDSKEANRLTGPELLASAGTPCEWMPGSDSLLCELIPARRGAAPEPSPVPIGPTIQEAGGQRAPMRTYQNLLHSPFDELLFEHYFTGQLALIPLHGERTLIGDPTIYVEWRPAPDGERIVVSRITRPYSYLVPLWRFPREVEVWDLSGRVIHSLASLPLAESVPIGGVPEGPRAIRWQPGSAGTLVWTEALDGGDPKAEADHRDRLMMLDSPYSGEATELARTELRISRTRWSENGELALAWTRDRSTRVTKTVVIDATRPGADDRVIWDRSSEDAYSDPGDLVMRQVGLGESVLLFSPDGKSIYLQGDGSSPAGDHPFLDRYDLATGRSERLWQNEDPYYETVSAVLEGNGVRILTRRESKTEPPNYFIHDLGSGDMTALTDMEDPAPQLTGIERKRIHYTRADGVELQGMLYLPADYEEGTPMPTVVWAYPREYRAADAAGQVRGSENLFTFYRGYSHLFFLTQGYVVLDRASMPVVGEGAEEPNNTFVDQLVMNGQAAVDALVEMGVTDPQRVGVGGHSYGAFMTANLLAHSDIFRAGIARSGAYNRSLTPFGFQNERRTFWEAPEIYFAMSPFMHAEAINEPILLLHGEEDTNSGTFPVQSRRMYHAVKGLGGTIKLVMYPDEQHGYRARETVLDALYQQFEWFDRWVKDASRREPERATSPDEAGSL